MTAMTEIQPEVPAEESRGGAHPDWDRSRPGQELPDRDAEHYDGPPETDPRFLVRNGRTANLRPGGITPLSRQRELALLAGPDDDDDCGVDEMDVSPLYEWCGHPGCGGD